MRVVAWLALFVALGGSLPAQAQVAKPDAAVGRVGVLGEIPDVESRIIHNSLQSELSRAYKLVSQQDYNQAEELAFKELAADQCTEEQCIRKIQEILQVDRLFHLQIIRDRGLTQITLTLIRKSDRIVRANNCEDCPSPEINRVVGRLVAEIVAADQGGTPPVVAQPQRAPQKQAPSLASYRFKWISMLTLGLVAAGYSYAEAQAVAESNQRQSDLLNEINTSTTLSQSAYDTKVSQLNAAEKSGATHKTTSDAAAGVSVLFLGLAAWIYLDPPLTVAGSALILPTLSPDARRVQVTYMRRW